MNDRPKYPKRCVACGKHHKTSDICGREEPEHQYRDCVPRRHDGYSLERAKNMGMFEDVDNWE